MTSAQPQSQPVASDRVDMTPAWERRVSGAALPRPLRPWVRACYELETPLPPSAPTGLAIPVSATILPALNVTLGEPPLIRIGRGFRLPPVTLAGPQPEPYTVIASATMRGFFVLFDTLGPLVLLGVEDYSVEPDGARPLHEMVRPALREATRTWEEQLLCAPGFQRRLELTTRFLLDCRCEPDARARLLRRALDAIDAAGGNVRIDALAHRLGTSASTLRRHFAVLGMSPKHFASIVRFRRAHAWLRHHPRATWADVVLRFGYADQAHFVREYHRYSGASPTQWESPLRVVDRRMGIDGLPAAPR